MVQTHVEIDDLLTEATRDEEAIKIFRQVLKCCKEKNIKLARYKLECGPDVGFTGTHIGGPDWHHPTSAKIDSIINLPPPSNLTQIRSLIGC